jgi:hypothetical protein
MGIYRYLLTAACLIPLFPGCATVQNPVYQYFENAELQCEEVQEETIKEALYDILTLPEDKLRERRYSEYRGREARWDLPTLIYRHFVPPGNARTLGDNFYRDVKSRKVQKKVEEFLRRLE